MKPFKPLVIFTLATVLLAGCWEGDPEFTVEQPVTKYAVQATIPEFRQCSLEERVALEREKPVLVLPSINCENGMCEVSGRGYNDKDKPFHIAQLNAADECEMIVVGDLEFSEFYTLDVAFNGDYLRSIGLRQREIDDLSHSNFAGSKNGNLRASLINELNGDVRITIFYEELPTDDEFIVSGQRIAFELP